MKYVNVKINNDLSIIININNSKLNIGMPVIIQSKNDLEYGIITKIFNDDCKINKTRGYSFLRFATSNDKKNNKKNDLDAQKAFIKCRELIRDYKLPMKLISATYTFTKDQLIFKFYSDSRVDFRKLARDLAKIYHTRIELRQVGVRDKAKEIGGCGQCGRNLCCKGFLEEFNSVSINMAKNQNISLNPNKINGICGRLLCCLKYEDDCYKECRKNLPHVGDIVKSKSGSGKVLSIDPLAQKYKIITEAEEIIVCDVNDSFK